MLCSQVFMSSQRGPRLCSRVQAEGWMEVAMKGMDPVHNSNLAPKP